MTMSEDWRREGLAVLPGFASAEECARDRRLCDRVLETWRAANPAHVDTTNIDSLTEPDYWRDDRAGLFALLERIVDRRILAAIG